MQVLLLMREENYVYVKSVDELKSYYDASKDGLEAMKEDVFDSDKYNQAFFKDKCLLLYFHRTTFAIDITHTKIESISEVNDVLNIKILFFGATSDLSLDSICIAIELDKEHIDKKVKLIEEFSEE